MNDRYVRRTHYRKLFVKSYGAEPLCDGTQFRRPSAQSIENQLWLEQASGGWSKSVRLANKSTTKKKERKRKRKRKRLGKIIKCNIEKKKEKKRENKMKMKWYEGEEQGKIKEECGRKREREREMAEKWNKVWSISWLTLPHSRNEVSVLLAVFLGERHDRWAPVASTIG